MSEQPQQVTEAPTTPIAEAPKEPESQFGEQFKRIAKQEKYIQTERQKIEEARKSLEAEKALAESYKSLKGKNPFEILEHFGITYDQLLQADKERANPVDPNVKRALDTVEQLRKELSDKEEEALKARMSRAEIQLQADIDKEIKDNEHDLIEKLGAKNAVKEYMEEIYETTGEIPTIKEACEAVTAYIAEQYLSVKDSKWLKPKEEAKPVEVAETPVKKSETISNKMTQTSTRLDKPMTDSERMAAAIRAMSAASSK